MDKSFIIDNLTYLLYIPSVLAFLLFGLDKHRSVYNYRRIPGFLLYLPTILMGAFGAMCGMIFFNHLTKRNLYLVGVPFLLLLQVIAIVLFKIYLV